MEYSDEELLNICKTYYENKIQIISIVTELAKKKGKTHASRVSGVPRPTVANWMDRDISNITDGVTLTKERILKYIKDNKLKSGDRLPVRKEFAPLIKSHTNHINTAIVELQKEGILEAYRGVNGGTFIV